MVSTLTVPNFRPLADSLAFDLERFPDTLYVSLHASTGKYGCYCYKGVYGLACFSTEFGAERFTERIDLTGMAVMEVSFDQAREIAKDRPLPVTAIMLLNNINDPTIHFVH